jgi:lipopolysaccharide/colanic/teichoic acid biosynthesis glycosyltransferase
LTQCKQRGEKLIRFLSLLVAAVGIVLLAPVMILTGIVVAVTSPGPILYRQLRVGRDRRRVIESDPEKERRSHNAGGKLFTMFKFRSMSHRPAARSAEIWARQADPRVTAFGAHIRRHRLDEVPQLFNVLRGDMNVVGPRPEQPQLFLELRDQVDGYAERQTVHPGITGWAQINLPYDRCVEDVRRKVALDLQYLGRRSPTEDLRIMARTLPVMVSKRGAL